MRRILVTLLLAFVGVAHSEEKDDAFSKWAATHAFPVATVEPGEDVSDLLPLKTVVGNARVVAFGEPLHGAHEPQAFRNRLFRFLVEQMGFTAIATEFGFTDSAVVEQFVGGGPGDASSVIAAQAAPFDNLYVENRDLIQWMRDYNDSAAKTGHRKIRYYGLDLSFGGRPGGAQRAIDYALAYLALADASDADRIRSSLGESLPPSDEKKFGGLSEPALAALDGAIAEIAKAMAKNRRELIAHGSADDYRFALHNLEVARQLSKCFHVTTPLSFKDMRYAPPVMKCRDTAMAENVQWIVENEGAKGRVFVFAHNGHVMNDKNDGRRWAKVPEKDRPPMMGVHLRRAFGTRLLIIGSSSATASAEFPALKTDPDDLDVPLARVGMSKMFLDLRSARKDPAAFESLTRRRPLRAESNSLITPSTAADAFFFVDRVTPAIEFSAKPD